MTSTLRFGYLPFAHDVHCGSQKATRLESFDESRRWVEAHRHADGHVYPPASWTEDERGTKNERSDRPAHLFRLPATHALSCAGNTVDRHQESFALHLIGFCFGQWLQFEDWWFDMRVAVDGHTGFLMRDGVRDALLDQAERAWNSWTPDVRSRFTNALYMHSRAPAYEWDWEQFMMEYAVFDALWRTARELRGIKIVPHSKRLHVVCNEYGIAEDADQFSRFVALRNDLVHETLWDRGMPGAARSGESFMAPRHLHRLNQRLVPAILGFPTPFLRSAWWTMSTFMFEAPA